MTDTTRREIAGQRGLHIFKGESALGLCPACHSATQVYNVVAKCVEPPTTEYLKHQLCDDCISKLIVAARQKFPDQTITIQEGDPYA